MICLISLSKFSDVLTAFTCASAIGNLLSICLGVSVFLIGTQQPEVDVS